MFSKVMQVGKLGKIEIVGVSAYPLLTIRIFIGKPSVGAFTLCGTPIRGDIFIQQREMGGLKIQRDILRDTQEKHGNTVSPSIEKLCDGIGEIIYKLIKGSNPFMDKIHEAAVSKGLEERKAKLAELQESCKKLQEAITSDEQFLIDMRNKPEPEIEVKTPEAEPEKVA